MKKYWSLLILVLITTVSKAQPPTYDDLLILFADGNYPKLIRECEKYADKDETKNDAMVYLYWAKGLFKVSFEADKPEELKNAYKETFNALGKFIKKDKEGKLIGETETQEFIVEVKKSLLEAIVNEIDAKDYRKAAGWAGKAYKLNQQDIGAKYLEGACKYRTGDKGGANALWKEAEKLLAGMTTFESLSKEDKTLFRIGILEAAECMVDMRQKDKAVNLLNKVAQWFEKDDTFKARYDEIVNGVK